MKPIDLLRLSFTNLWGNKLRTLLTILGVSIGISAIVFLYSLGTGLQELTINRITKSEALTTLDVSTGGSSILALDNQALETFKRIDHVELVSPIISLSGQVANNEITTDILISGVEPIYSTLQAISIKEGTFLPSVQTERPSVVLTTSVMNLLGYKEIDKQKEMLNKPIKLTFFIPKEGGDLEQIETKTVDYTLAGVVDNDTESVAYVPVNELINQGVNKFSMVKIKLKTIDHVQEAKQKFTDSGYTVSSVQDLVTQINRVFRIIQYVLAGFGVISLSVASIGMFNTMTIALLERTRDIGIMRALGARAKDIRRVFLTEAITIGTIGGVIGIALAYLLSRTITLGLAILASKAGADPLELFAFPVPFMVLVLGFSVIVGLLTGVYPAIRAARLNPLQALRYE